MAWNDPGSWGRNISNSYKKAAYGSADSPDSGRDAAVDANNQVSGVMQQKSSDLSKSVGEKYGVDRNTLKTQRNLNSTLKEKTADSSKKYISGSIKSNNAFMGAQSEVKEKMEANAEL